MADAESAGPPHELGPEERTRHGLAWYEIVTTKSTPPALETPFFKSGMIDIVMGEIWSRPSLDRRSRRWISLTGAAAAGTLVPIQSHVYSALKSGDITIEEMHEFVLHFAVYGGWPRASLINQTVIDTWARIQQEGGPSRRDGPEAPR